MMRQFLLLFRRLYRKLNLKHIIHFFPIILNKFKNSLDNKSLLMYNNKVEVA